MLGRTAGSLFWMSRYLERAENVARLVEAGFQIALTSPQDPDAAWESILNTASVLEAYQAEHSEITQSKAVDFLLRDKKYGLSVRSMMEKARDNARAARTTLTREVWEAVNQSWLNLNEELTPAIRTKHLPARLESVRRHTALVRGTLHGTMLRNDAYDFTRLGTLIERFEATARILDVKYYVLLPSFTQIGSKVDNIQWETILRSVSGFQSYRWLYNGEIDAVSIANYLIFDTRFPRSMSYSLEQIQKQLIYLAKDYGEESPALGLASAQIDAFKALNVERVFTLGLHECLQDMITRSSALAAQIETDYRFYG